MIVLPGLKAVVVVDLVSETTGLEETITVEVQGGAVWASPQTPPGGGLAPAVFVTASGGFEETCAVTV